MNKTIIFLGVNKIIIDTLLKRKIGCNILVFSDKICLLEQIMKRYKASVYPIIDKNYDLINLNYLLEKKYKVIDEIVLSLDSVFESKPIENINFDKIKYILDRYFSVYIYFLRFILKFLLKSKSKLITIVINKKPTDKSFFAFQHSCINNLLITLMNEFNKEYKSVRLNCISLENVDTTYKNGIYPYRLQKFKNPDLFSVYQYLSKFMIKNKILVL